MGSSDERAFVRAFSGDGHGWFAQRAAASGSATTNDLPDVTFAHDGIAFAGEQKTVARSATYIYVEAAEVDALDAYATAYGMQPVVIGRWKGERAYYVWHPDAMSRTDGGTYRGGRDDGKWAVKIADPEGAAEGVAPAELSGFALTHFLQSDIAGQRTSAPGNGEGAYIPDSEVGYE